MDPDLLEFLQSEAAATAPLMCVTAVLALRTALGAELGQECYEDLLRILEAHARSGRPSR